MRTLHMEQTEMLHPLSRTVGWIAWWEGETWEDGAFGATAKEAVGNLIDHTIRIEKQERVVEVAFATTDPTEVPIQHQEEPDFWCDCPDYGTCGEQPGQCNKVCG